MNPFIAFNNFFVKLTGYIPQKVVFNTKIYYENKKIQSRRIKGPAIIISNHTSVYDYAVMLFVFPCRTLRYQMAELQFKKKILGTFLKMMGGICVDRDAHNFSFMQKSEEILKRGGVVGVFPESRLKRKDETGLIDFKPSVTVIALEFGVPIIPVYTDGNYFGKGRAHMTIGTPINARELYDESLTEKENVQLITQTLQQKVALLGEMTDERKKS